MAARIRPNNPNPLNPPVVEAAQGNEEAQLPVNPLEDEGNQDEFEDVEDEEVPAYKLRIALPSSITRDEITERGITDVLEAELELRKGQAEDRLADIRILLAWSAALFRQGIRSAQSYRARNRAWAESRNITKTVRRHARVYQLAQSVLIKYTYHATPEGKEIRAKYRDLTSADLKISTEILSFDVRGNRNTALSWIWSGAAAAAPDNDEWLRECK